MNRLMVGDVVVLNCDPCKSDVEKGYRVYYEIFPTPGYAKRGAHNFYADEHAIILECTIGYSSSWSSQYDPPKWCKIITSSGRVGYISENTLRKI